ncbi:STAS domain-containing protein [Rossellomorea aquimaris]|uniref:STAS domain-containing protein n=1 Tax=Rossellomorea aquimaris TaxID=189382 RepID=UPI0007D07FC6|nr:STAS domain-containing protein [Rossellomorea aquimaris]
MEKTLNFTTYFQENTEEIVAKWLGFREKDEFSIFNSNASTKVEKQLIEESSLFINYMTNLLENNENSISKELKDWSQLIAQKRVNDGTSIEKVLEQFKIFRHLYFQYMKEFFTQNPDYFHHNLFKVIEDYHLIFDDVIQTFVDSFKKHYENRLIDQLGLINELSSPVISLTDHIAILPLIGDIDTSRAKYIMEHTLRECSDMEIEHLVIDLSAVAVVDTMVAQKIFELFNALKIVGVNPIITGIRPSIAQTAVQLGIEFNSVTIHSTLMNALKSLGYSIDNTK